MGAHRFAHRDREAEPRRALRMAQGHSRSHRSWPSQQPHRRLAPLELQASVKLKAGSFVRIAYGSALVTGRCRRLPSMITSPAIPLRTLQTGSRKASARTSLRVMRSIRSRPEATEPPASASGALRCRGSALPAHQLFIPHFPSIVDIQCGEKAILL